LCNTVKALLITLHTAVFCDKLVTTITGINDIINNKLQVKGHFYPKITLGVNFLLEIVSAHYRSRFYYILGNIINMLCVALVIIIIYYRHRKQTSPSCLFNFTFLSYVYPMTSV